ncbi:MAG: hypothetical protein AAF530_01780 [Pseudomonadota bacterium]
MVKGTSLQRILLQGLLKGVGFRGIVIAVAVVLFGPVAGVAGDVEVVDAQASQASDGTWTFRVTLAHADTGWEHYADAWEILSPDGKVLGTRVLLHPHENEQPFTRSLGGVVIPEDITEVIVRGHDSVHGHGESRLTVELDR